MNQIYEKYETIYKSKAADLSNELRMRVWIGTMYCNDTNLNPNNDEELDNRLRELAAIEEELLIDCIFDAINAHIYKKQGLI